MQTVSENGNPLERRLKVVLPHGAIAAEVEGRLKRLGRTVKLHGFRPGKVPMRILQQHYGPQVQREVLEDALKNEFSGAVREQSLKVAGLPRFELEAPAEGADQYEFTAVFEVYPEVQVGDLAHLAIERLAASVEDSNVDKTIEVLRRQRASYAAADRPAAQGDRVTISYRGTIGGEGFAGGEAQNVPVMLGDGRFLKAFEDALIGVSAGAHRSFELTFPADYHGKEVAGKTATFEITVHQVEEALLPPVDEAFAQALGVEDGDIGRLRAEVRGNLERELSRRIHERLRDQVMQGLLDATAVEVPKTLVQAEIARMTHGSGQESAAHAVSEALVPEARRRVALGLILSELVRAQHLEAKPDQVRALVEDLAEAYEKPEEVVKWYYQNPAQLKEIELRALEDNVVAWVLQNAKVEERASTFDELMGNAK
ncbi:MAG: trigger factor [Betaproteobacteria bacterium]|nr:trigger factor [Betaproteobacteria bacterium]